MRFESTNRQITSAVGDGWVHGGSFLSSVLAGALLGYLTDRWLGTDPWLVVAGILLGAYAGFVKVWGYLKKLDGETDDR